MDPMKHIEHMELMGLIEHMELMEHLELNKMKYNNK